MKKFISMMMIFLLVSVPAQYLAATAKQPQKLGAQINNTIAIAAATGANQQGTALMYVVLQGQPAKLAVVDIVKNELIDTKNLGDSTSAWGLMVDKSNTVWIGGTPTEHLYSYNPDTRVLKDCGKASGKLSSSIHDLEEGRMARFMEEPPMAAMFLNM
ncbi:hypothetical protein RCG23_14440 [Neobacillus sp. PS3-34]|uniref:hypothetical protein n=1 Tax=Neobacillus sp. PS3-34 TaxID=3070678 RepID=UPI0027E046A7|nr:hypothetical protein [Neobacillus sp. PS3-34]WML46835.1 hypothetical protein RCG23_14440 [Neobacillus sp. PS3-34]